MLLLALSFFITNVYAQNFTIIQIPAQFTTVVPSSTGTLLPVGTCTGTCMNDSLCIVSYSDKEGYCINYSYGDIPGAGVTYVNFGSPPYDYVVAFKINQVTTCPADFKTMGRLSYVDLRNNASYPFRWLQDDSSIFMVGQCANPYTVIRRGDAVLCVMREVVTGKNRNDSKSACRFKMRGVFSQAELDYISSVADGDTWIDGDTGCNYMCPYTWSNDDLVTPPVRLVPTKVDDGDAFCLSVSSAGVLQAKSCTDTTATGVYCGLALFLT